MLGPSPRRRHSPEPPLLRRLDRAAGALNPILMIIVLGLTILNLIFFFLAALPVRITRTDPDGTMCPIGTVCAARSSTGETPGARLGNP